MKITSRCWLLAAFVALASSLSAQVIDDFNDGDFSTSPNWSGDDANFEVDGSLRLHLLAPAETDESFLSTPSIAINNAQWDIELSLDFNPSASNRSLIYLCSDQANLEGSLNGYFVMVGNTDDELSLYRQDGTTIEKIIDGSDDLIDIDPVDMAIRVTRDSEGNWELFYDLGISGTYLSEGVVFDDTHTASEYFGVLCDYTSTRSESFWFDNVIVSGEGFIDDVPPTLVSLSVTSPTTLDLEFNEELDPSSAENTLNYTLLPDLMPVNADLVSTLVTLTFNDPIPENITLSLEIESVADLAGNPISNYTENFVNLVLGLGNPNDIVINEIMADPSPSQGLPEAEYVELYNQSDSAFNLQGWNLQNSDVDEILDSLILLPGEYVIICDDSFFSIFNDLGQTLAVTSFTALSNGGDDIRLINTLGTLISEVIYDISWYGGEPFDDGGYSLERSIPGIPCDNPSNWSASTQAGGGTPGQENAMFFPVDLVSPIITGLEVISNETLSLSFSEGMDDLSLMTSNYTIDPDHIVVPLSIDNLMTVSLSVSPPLEPGNTYTLQIAGATDCSGNGLVGPAIEFLISSAAASGDILINEIMADPSPAIALPELEYLEIINRTSNKVFDLSAWTLRNSTTDMVLAEHVMEPGDILILCDEDDIAEFSPFGTVIPIAAFTALSNSGDDLYLYAPDGSLIDQVSYTSSWYNDSDRDDGGFSLERINPDLPCSDATNWRASIAQEGGTPGQANSVLDLSPDVTSPMVESVSMNGGQQVAIRFSEAVEINSLEEGDITISPEVSVLGYGQPEPAVLTVNLDDALTIGQIHIVTILGIEDCSGNVMDETYSSQIALPLEFEEGDFKINEILFNPNTGGVDFVEIYNDSDKPLSLRNWKMANREMGEMTNLETITTDELVVFPGEFKVLTEDPENIRFEYPLGQSEHYIEINDLPAYPDDEGYVLLVDPAIEVHDEFFYSKDYHFSLIDDQDGVSLERIDYTRITNDPTNWHSAAETVGWATPGYENSQLQPASISSESFTIEPEVFSPDNDGFQDVLNISYSLERPGSVANISIFDREGRRVRVLTANELLSISGTISWDGTTDEGLKARIGVYVLFIELFDQEGNVSSTKKTAVLGGRL